MRQGFLNPLAAIFLVSFFVPAVARAMSWSAQPLTVHEWGVQEFDWNTAAPVKTPLPGFIYTDDKPGIAAPAPEKRVKDYPPDSGVRFKPVLYFYLPEFDRLGESIVGVEMRFAYGHANAWFPQVNLYRSPDLTANAREPDWEAWMKANAKRRYDPKQTTPIPDDPRMELVWSRLSLSKELPAGAKLQDDLPENHWIRTARKVQSAYVANGNEAEKFLFYEDATHEKPSIAIIPSSATYFL